MRDIYQSNFVCIWLITAVLSSIFREGLCQNDQSFSCGSDQIHEALLKTDLQYLWKYQRFQKEYQRRMNQPERHQGRQAVVYTIPLVVHIIHNGAALGTDANPTDEMVANIVAEASQRFRHAHQGAGTYTNPFYGSDTEIELCLATTDPDGNYSSGVTRHYDPTNAIGDYSDIAPGLNSVAWDKSAYCNLYIVTDLTNASGVYMGGYDFTIYDAPAFWSGLIAHELGHYFNLRHTFNGGCTNGNCLTNGDEVCDTPPKATSGFGGGTCGNPSDGCSTDDDDLSSNNPYRPIANGGMGNQPDMFANYLDYTGSCWDSFTEGQKTRMRTNIGMYRSELKDNSAACSGSLPTYDVGVTSVSLNQAEVCQSTFTPQVTFKNYGTSTITSLNIIVEDNQNPITSTPWSGSLVPGQTVSIALSSPVVLSVSDHLLRFYTSTPNGNEDANHHNDSDYRMAQYLGGSSCETLSGCSNFHANTASGPGNNTIVNVSGSYPVSALDVQICVKVQGDVGYAAEVFDVYDEGGTLRGQTNYLVDCTSPSAPFCFIVSATDYNNWISDGSITVTLSPISSEINPNLCNINQACIDVNVPQSEDCDPMLILNGTITSGLHQASNYIQAGGIIHNATNVIFGANNYSVLSNGFEIQQGGILEILNVGCN